MQRPFCMRPFTGFSIKDTVLICCYSKSAPNCMAVNLGPAMNGPDNEKHALIKNQVQLL